MIPYSVQAERNIRGYNAAKIGLLVLAIFMLALFTTGIASIPFISPVFASLSPQFFDEGCNYLSTDSEGSLVCTHLTGCDDGDMVRIHMPSGELYCD